MKRVVIFLIFPLLVSACQAQNDKKPQKGNSKISQDQVPITRQPKVDVKVNKKYDDNGNLVGYDSTYSWSYSTIQGDTVNIDADSAFSQFKPLFDTHFPNFSPNLYDDFFGLDSSFYQDFMSPLYFHDRWQKALMQQEKTFREMDSLKNAFFNEHYPGLARPGK